MEICLHSSQTINNPKSNIILPVEIKQLGGSRAARRVEIQTVSYAEKTYNKKEEYGGRDNDI